MHQQVPFKTVSGKRTRVDKGLFDILTELKRLNVNTLFSCEGKPGKHAYFKANGVGPLRLLWKMRSYANNANGEIGRYFLSLFVISKKSFTWNWLSDNGALRSVKAKPVESGDFITIEFQWTNKYGLSTIIRWPQHLNEDFLSVLKSL